MRVFDSSAIVNALLRDGASRRLMNEDEVVVSQLADVEVAHALRRVVRTGEIPERGALQALLGWQESPVPRFPATPWLRRIWELRGNLTAYDATHVALAEAFRVELLTADRRIAGAPGVRCAVTVVMD